MSEENKFKCLNIPSKDAQSIHISISAYLPTDEEPEPFLIATSSYGGGGGNDLADGPYDTDTLDRIISDVITVIGGWRKSYDFELGESPMFKTPISEELSSQS